MKQWTKEEIKALTQEQWNALSKEDRMYIQEKFRTLLSN